MLKPLKLPRGILNILMIGNCTTLKVTEDIAYRPDKIPELLNTRSAKEEILDNYMSNKSPLTMKKGDTYIVTDALFKNYFSNL